MVYISAANITPDMGKDNKPAAFCQSGDMVVFETKDCYNNALAPDGSAVEGALKMANPATGPLFVNGAEPGDVLKVEILDIKTAPFALMRGRPGSGVFADILTDVSTRSFDLSGEKIDFFGHQIDADVMIGVIGTAPENEPVTTDTPHDHGGNMDCKKIVKGAILYLPVFHAGALLSMGDLHARMGDGEVLICGLECAGEISVRVSVLKNLSLPTPFLYSRGQVMTIQSRKTLDEAARLAAIKMHKFMGEEVGMSQFEAGAVLSVLGDLAVCQVVDPLMTARMELDIEVLEKYGWRLP